MTIFSAPGQLMVLSWFDLSLSLLLLLNLSHHMTNETVSALLVARLSNPNGAVITYVKRNILIYFPL